MKVDNIQLELWLGMMKSDCAGVWQRYKIGNNRHIIPAGILENIQEICELALVEAKRRERINRKCTHNPSCKNAPYLLEPYCVLDPGEEIDR